MSCKMLNFKEWNIKMPNIKNEPSLSVESGRERERERGKYAKKNRFSSHTGHLLPSSTHPRRHLKSWKLLLGFCLLLFFFCLVVVIVGENFRNICHWQNGTYVCMCRRPAQHPALLSSTISLNKKCCSFQRKSQQNMKPTFSVCIISISIRLRNRAATVAVFVAVMFPLLFIRWGVLMRVSYVAFASYVATFLRIFYQFNWGKMLTSIDGIWYEWGGRRKKGKGRVDDYGCLEEDDERRREICPEWGKQLENALQKEGMRRRSGGETKGSQKEWEQ